MDEDLKKKKPRRFFRAPIKAGEEYHVKILGKGKYGDSFARVKGFIVFFKGGEIGEEVDIKITKVFPKFALATIK